MPRHVENEIFQLKIFTENLLNDTYDEIDILSAESVITPEFVSLSSSVQTTLCIIGWLNLAIFTYFRYIVYKHFWNQYKGKELKHINVLTLFVCLFQHIFFVTFQTHHTLIVTYGIPFEDIIDSTWACVPMRLIYSFEQRYSIIGSLGIAVYRILLIKHNDFVKNTFGPKNLVGTILSIEFVMTVILSVPAFDLLEPIRPKCMFLPKYNILQILDDYGQSVGLPHMSFLMLRIRVSSWLLMMLFSFFELSIYVGIFYFLYTHDNSENLRRILDYQCIKARNKKNGVSFFAHFCSFVIELMLMIGCVIALTFGKTNNFVYPFLTTLKKICLTCMAVIEVVASSTLRSRVLH